MRVEAWGFASRIVGVLRTWIDPPDSVVTNPIGCIPGKIEGLGLTFSKYWNLRTADGQISSALSRSLTHLV